MDLKQYLRVLRAHWLLVVGCILIFTGAGAANAFLQQPQYAAETQLFIAIAPTGGSDAASAAYQGGLFSQQRVKSYADIVASAAVLEPVRTQLQLPYSLKQLTSKVSASAPLDTVLVNIVVTDSSPERARALPRRWPDNSRSTSFNSKHRAALGNSGQGQHPRPPQTPTDPISPNKSLDIALGLLVGISLGVLGAVLREVFDNSVRSRDEAVELVGAPVLASLLEDSANKRSQLVVLDQPNGPTAEAFRRLRTNIRFLGID